MSPLPAQPVDPVRETALASSLFSSCRSTVAGGTQLRDLLLEAMADCSAQLNRRSHEMNSVTAAPEVDTVAPRRWLLAKKIRFVATGEPDYPHTLSARHCRTSAAVR